eukprot:m.612020 g.612020  ORF g.612020 m.612020 type:complete len:70 (-) comp22500_c0_seq59:3826-4035(-)
MPQYLGFFVCHDVVRLYTAERFITPLGALCVARFIAMCSTSTSACTTMGALCNTLLACYAVVVTTCCCR